MEFQEKEYIGVIKIEWVQSLQAESRENAIQIIKDSFYQEYGIDLADNELVSVEEIE